MSAAGEGGKEKGPGGACELCGAAARVYCGADEATLCWGCDAQVHGANFLVARHARALLCRGCARPTPWRAAGPRLGPTASLCDRCVRRGGPGGGGGGAGADEEMGGAGGGGDGEDDDGEGEDEVVVEDEDEDDEEEEGEGENQVVPWTEEADATPPPVASSTSSSSREAAANATNAAVCAKEEFSSGPICCQKLVAKGIEMGDGEGDDEAPEGAAGDGNIGTAVASTAGDGPAAVAGTHPPPPPTQQKVSSCLLSRAGATQPPSFARGRRKTLAFLPVVEEMPIQEECEGVYDDDGLAGLVVEPVDDSAWRAGTIEVPDLTGKQGERPRLQPCAASPSPRCVGDGDRAAAWPATAGGGIAGSQGATSCEEDDEVTSPALGVGPSGSCESRRSLDRGLTFGRSIVDLLSHSWSPAQPKWLWLPKGALHLTLGFAASVSDISRFRSNARRVVRAEQRQRDARSFAEVVCGMKPNFQPERRGEGIPGRSGDRSPDRRGRHDRWSSPSAGQQWRQGPREGTWGNKQDWSRHPEAGSSAPHGGGRRGPAEAQPPPPLPQSRGRGGQDGGGPHRAEQDHRSRAIRERVNRSQEGAIPATASKAKKKAGPGDMCFNCNRTGHFAADCSEPLYCYNCKTTGHRATECPRRKALKLCAFGMPGQMFYSIRVPGMRGEKKKIQINGLMSIKEGVGSMEAIEAEFEYQFKGNGGWKIKMLSQEQFLISFPDEEMRKQLTRFRIFGFETSAITASVTATEIPFEEASRLESTWVKASGFPTNARDPDIVNEVAFLVGDPLEIDLASLNGEGPIRIKIECRDVAAIGGETEVFFNGESKRISWQVETQGKDNKPTGPSRVERKRKHNDDEETDEKEDEFDSHTQNSKHPHQPQSLPKSKDSKVDETQKGKQMGCKQPPHQAMSVQEHSNESSHYMLSQSNPQVKDHALQRDREDSFSQGLEQVDYGTDTVDTRDPTETEIEEMRRFEEEITSKTENVAESLALPPEKEMALQLEMTKYQKTLARVAACETPHQEVINPTPPATASPRSKQKIKVRQEPAVGQRQTPRQQMSSTPLAQRTAVVPSG